MKKNIKFIIPIILILLLTALLIVTYSDDSSNYCYNVSLDDIFTEINFATNGSFEKKSIQDAQMNFPLDFSKSIDFIYARSNEDYNEYFMIIKDFNKNQLDELKFNIEKMKELNIQGYSNSNVYTINGYTYLVVSNTNNSLIEGIIRNFVYCN